MGYETYFQLSYSDGDGTEKEGLPGDVLKFLNEDADGLTAIELDPEYILDAVDDSCRCKWYHYDDDMVKLSDRFPQYRFILWGDGEESLDMWRKMWQKGQCIMYQYVDQLPPLPKELLKF